MEDLILSLLELTVYGVIYLILFILSLLPEVLETIVNSLNYYIKFSFFDEVTKLNLLD